MIDQTLTHRFRSCSHIGHIILKAEVLKSGLGNNSMRATQANRKQGPLPAVTQALTTFMYLETRQRQIIEARVRLRTEWAKISDWAKKILKKNVILKPGFHMIVRIVRIVPVVSKNVQTIGTIIWKRYPDDRKRPGRLRRPRSLG